MSTSLIGLYSLPAADFWKIKVVKQHSSWNRADSSHRIIGDRDGICRIDNQYAPCGGKRRADHFHRSHPSERTAAAATSMAFTEFRRQLLAGGHFFGQA
jgi:hypothetical protein